MTGINVNGVGGSPYVSSYLTSAKNRRNTTSKNTFLNAMQEVEESKNSADTEKAKFDGNVVIPQPPAYSNPASNNTLSDKSKDEMTMDEYKQWVVNEISKMPVSAWVRSTCVGGALTITDKAFERMKSDPEWENTVFDMVRKMYSVNGIMGTKMVSFQVIGASPEECYGEAIPIHDSSETSSHSDGKESWWKKRRERMEELLKEQKKTAIEKEQARQKAEQEEYLNRQLVVAAYEKNSIILPGKENVL